MTPTDNESTRVGKFQHSGFCRGRNLVTLALNVSLLGALSLDGLIASMSVKGSVNTDVFLTYLTKVLLPQLWQGAIVVLDNLKVPECCYSSADN